MSSRRKPGSIGMQPEAHPGWFRLLCAAARNPMVEAWMPAAGILGVAIERIALRPLRGVGGTAAMITTIGVSYILFNIILLTVGASSLNYPNPLPAVRWNVAGAVLQLREVLIWGITVAL